MFVPFVNEVEETRGPLTVSISIDHLSQFATECALSPAVQQYHLILEYNTIEGRPWAFNASEFPPFAFSIKIPSGVLRIIRN